MSSKKAECLVIRPLFYSRKQCATQSLTYRLALLLATSIRAKTRGWRGGSRIEPRKTWQKAAILDRDSKSVTRFPWNQVVGQLSTNQKAVRGARAEVDRDWLLKIQNFTQFLPSRLPVFIYVSLFVKPGPYSQETWVLWRIVLILGATF